MTYSPNTNDKLERAVLSILGYHTGRASAISGKDLLFRLQQQGYRLPDERIMREAIHQLRRGGNLICSTPKDGYWMAATHREWMDFDEEQFGSRIADMSKTRAAMRQAAINQFGNQLELI
jgi:hypothetical protein